MGTSLRQSTSFAFQRNAWIDSGYKFATVYRTVLYHNAMLNSTVNTICVSPRSPSYFSAMLGLTVDTCCRAHRRFRSGMAIVGMLVAMPSCCVHFVVGRPVESPQVQSLRQFQLLALPAGTWCRLFGALCTGTGHVHWTRPP